MEDEDDSSRESHRTYNYRIWLVFLIFMSYPIAADRRHAISKFRAELERSLQEKTGVKSLRIFQDAGSIIIGESWRTRLYGELAEVPIFMPMVQPLYFTSDWCIRELLDFHSRIIERPSAGRILPILWERVRDVGDPGGQASQAWAILEPLHYFDWTGYRLRDWDEPKRLALDRLAAEITTVIDNLDIDLKEPSTRAHVSRTYISAPDPITIAVKLFDVSYVVTHDADDKPIHVPCSGHSMRVVVEAASDQAVVLLAVRPVVVSRKPPSGYLVPSAGIVPLRRFTLQLDDKSPRLISSNGGAGFPLKVTKDDPEVLEIQVETSQWYVTYVLELDWVCAGRQGTTQIDIAGVPFQCMATPPPPSYEWEE